MPIRVALCIADRTLRARVVEACEDADIAVAEPDASIEDADIVLADRPVETTAHLIALASSQERDIGRETWPADIRAVVPADIDAVTLGAVVAVVAGGLIVVPRQGLGGDVARAETVNAKIAGAWADPIDGADQLPIILTPREREVLALLAEGASNKEIARTLAVSVHTAKFHVASLAEKLGAHSRAEAIAIAIRTGLVMV
jgi:DNA-binding NarL/FixJ family response regulator